MEQEGKRSETKAREKGEGWEHLSPPASRPMGQEAFPILGSKINGWKLTIGGDRRLNFWFQEAIRPRPH